MIIIFLTIICNIIPLNVELFFPPSTFETPETKYYGYNEIPNINWKEIGESIPDIISMGVMFHIRLSMHLGIYNTAYETTYPERKRKKIKVATGNYAVGMMIFMGTGRLPWIQNAAGLSIYKSYGIKSNTSYVISQVMFFFIGYYDFKVLRFVPKVVFTLLLGVAGWGLIDVYGIR